MTAAPPGSILDLCCEGRCDPQSLGLDGDKLLRWLGYGPASPRPAEAVRRDLESALATAMAFIEPRWLWRIVSATADPRVEALRCGDHPRHKLAVGRMVLAQVSRSDAVAVFVVTIGPRLEEASRSGLAEGDPLAAYLLDAIGSAAVEAAADVMERELLATVAPRGWAITNRYSPGYCTWSTRDQHALFALLPNQPAGVTLTDHAVMQPVKSVSGIIGLGPRVQRRPYVCDLCSMEHCPRRLTAARPD